MIVSLHWPVDANTIVSLSISIGQNSSAIDCRRAFVGFGDEGLEMRPGSPCESIAAVHADLVAPVSELFDNLSRAVPQFVGAAMASVLIPGRGEVYINNI